MDQNNKNKKVIIGVSGGVDSTVAAHLLCKEGYDVIGASMIVDKDSLYMKHDIDDAKLMCDRLNIKHIVVDVSKRFKELIIDRFVKDYTSGLTPPPCSICNGKVKFQFLYDVMLKEGADFIATGHYAGVEKIGDRYAIRPSKNADKDQSYMLYSLTQEQISHLILPIGDMDKDEVRHIAGELGLEVSDKKDSQDICFIKRCFGTPDKHMLRASFDKAYVDFIKRYFFGDDYIEKIALGKLTKNKMEEKCPSLKKGKFIDVKSGATLGYHDGTLNYTIGQRKGFNMGFGERKYVTRLDAKKGEVFLGENKDLYNDEIRIKLDDVDTVWQGLTQSSVVENGACRDYYVKVRYRDKYNSCEVSVVGDEIIIKTKDPIRAITSGQVAVIYDKDKRILFGGIIKM